MVRLSHSAYRELFIFKGGLLLVQHEKTINAKQEARRGQLKSFKTVQALMDDLHKDDPYLIGNLRH